MLPPSTGFSAAKNELPNSNGSNVSIKRSMKLKQRSGEKKKKNSKYLGDWTRTPRNFCLDDSLLVQQLNMPGSTCASVEQKQQTRRPDPPDGGMPTLMPLLWATFGAAV